MSIEDKKYQIKIYEEEMEKIEKDTADKISCSIIEIASEKNTKIDQLKSIEIKIKALIMEIKVIETQNFAKKWKLWSLYM